MSVPFSESIVGQSIFARILALENAVEALQIGVDQMATAPFYTDYSIVTLTSGQAAGTDPVIGINSARKALQIQPPSNCTLLLAANSPTGTALIGGVPNEFIGTNPLWISGLTTGAKLVVWEGQ